MSAIRIYNSLTQKKEIFVESGKKIGIYVCGVTPYSHTHLGHARPSIVWDVIKKYLHYRGYETFHVQNFTDIDDKIIARANELGITPRKLADHYIKDYFEGMEALGVANADLYPKVSEHIPEIIAMITKLIAKGHAYASDGNVFYDVLSFPEYGKLSRQKLSELQVGTRFEVDPSKRHPLDFALWKKAKPEEPAWESPWGEGRPGWHIECSAMSYKYLGAEFDFHGGGCDLLFPHHENEIAQTEGATGKPLARYWLHNGMLKLKDAKMSKSLGNFISLQDLLAKYPQELLRFLILSSHYRSDLEFSEELLEDSRRGWQRFNDCVNVMANLIRDNEIEHQVVSGAEANLLETVSQTREKFEAAMDDDFNTALAIAALFELLNQVNSYIADVTLTKEANYVLNEAYQVFLEYAQDILGILKPQDQQMDGLTEPLMEILLELRTKLRQEKNYQLADYLRDQLGALDIVIEDTAQGPRWKLRS